MLLRGGTVNANELKFEAAGCCGEYRVANVLRQNGVVWSVYDDGKCGYRIVPMRDGVLCGRIEHGLSQLALAERLAGV